MIPAKELRIGNLVYIELPLTPTWKLHYITSQDIVDIESGAILKAGSEVHPIPIIPEVLKWCGFVQINETSWVDEQKRYTFRRENGIVNMYFKGGCSVRLNEPKHLHRLQNLIHELTDKELLITQ